MMKVKTIPYEGMMVKILVIEEGDKPLRCENCGNAKFDHPELAREVDEDWCLNCNDAAMGLSEKDYHYWVKEQIAKNKIIFIAQEVVE